MKDQPEETRAAVVHELTQMLKLGVFRPIHMVIDARLTTILVELDPTFKEFVRPDGTLCVRLIKALYGTVEAARLWYELITKVLLEYGFVPNKYERCVLNKTTALLEYPHIWWINDLTSEHFTSTRRGSLVGESSIQSSI